MYEELVSRLKATLLISDETEVRFREPKPTGFTFTISNTPSVIEQEEKRIKENYPFIIIEGKSEIDTNDPDFQCLYCEFKQP